MPTNRQTNRIKPKTIENKEDEEQAKIKPQCNK